MQLSKHSLRKKFIIERKKKFLKVKNLDFKIIFKLIKKNFINKKIIIAGYYPSNHEVNIIQFFKTTCEKNFKLALPVISSSSKMSFKSWAYQEPLYVSKFGTLEPERKQKDILPDLIIVPLVAFDKQLNRIGYGKGYYDRCLKEIKRTKKNSISLGVAHSFQKCKNIPINKYDFKLDYIFTEQGIISSNK